MRFRVRTKDLSSAVRRPTQVRFWVSGLGTVATRRWAKRVTYDWPAEILPANAEKLSVRAQLLAKGEAVSSFLPERFCRVTTRKETSGTNLNPLEP